MSPRKAFVIQKISDAADAFALAGTPLSAQQKTDKLYDLVKGSGLPVLAPASDSRQNLGSCNRA
jgi:hypothetical protein